jgi:glucose-6-phosphate 1-dehydrogenase
MNQSHPAGSPTSIVIFGASGDLTHRKLVPALYQLYRKGRLPAGARIVGFARRLLGHDEFRAAMREGAQEFTGSAFDVATWDRFAAQLWYVAGDLGTAGDYQRLHTFLREQEREPAHRLYYLATAPSFYVTIANCLQGAGMASEEEGWRRIIIEKPFGRDLASALALDAALHLVFQEQQIYRIDHYLGKETAQNILFFRFGNSIFEPVWNRTYIDHVQITVAESVPVGSRAGYYDQAGVLRDMLQNHLLQLMALVAMEPPTSFNADAIRNKTADVLAAIRPIPDAMLAHDTVRAQYRGYLQEPNVAADSQTPTYAALRLHVDNWRWQGVPFYLRSGKALATKRSEVVFQFRRPPHVMFPLPPGKEITPGMLSLGIQPDEGIHLRFEAKVPDTVAEMRSVNMTFHYDDAFGPSSIPEAYERLILDALTGDAALFIRSDAIEHAWKVIDPILQGWAGPAAPPVARYEPGSWGPAEADRLLAADGRAWLDTGGGHAVMAT